MATDLTSDADIHPGDGASSAASSAAVRTPDAVTRAFAFLTEHPVSLYAAAVLRIGYGLLYLAFLLREFPHRDEIWGPGSPWTPDLARELLHQSGWFSILSVSDNATYFEACYTVAVVTSVLFMLGWHARATSVLFAVVVTSFDGRDILMGDGGDNLTVLMALYLVCTACGRRWSLDARRRRLRTDVRKRGRIAARLAQSSASHPAALMRAQLTTILHNCGMFVIAAQVCILYGAAGLYKVQGGEWRDGTALHYVLNLDLFRPWPALSHAVDTHALLIAVGGYLTVLVQVALPFALFSRLKYVVLVLLVAMHLGIAVLMGLPTFSGAMIVADAGFLSDRLLLRAARTGRGVVFRRPAEAEAEVRSFPRPRRLNEGAMRRSARDTDLVLAYDGDCAFCQKAIDRITRWARPGITSMPWQALPAPTRARHQARLDREVLLLERDQIRLGGADALAYVLRSSQARSFRVSATIAGFPIVRTIARRVYRWVAANRHRMPAGTSSCALESGQTRPVREESGAEL
jgi:predicted DCC family thiol-disulfide oxidoreductase YuxK